MSETVGVISFLLLLAVLAVFDLRKKKVPLVGLLLLGASSLLCFLGAPFGRVVGLCLIPVLGLVYALSPRIRKDAGAADFAALMLCGPALPEAALEAGLLLSGLFVGAAALYLMLSHHSKKEEIPFLPFLCAGMSAGTVMSLWLK